MNREEGKHAEKIDQRGNRLQSKARNDERTNR